MRRFSASVFVMVSALEASAFAEPGDSAAPSAPVRSVEVGALVGYGFPVGSLEGGLRTSDLTPGIVPLDLDAAYHFNRIVEVVLRGRLAAVVPQRCGDASECIASLGRDASIGVEGRFTFPKLGPVTPRLSAGVGYEWLVLRVTDADVTSRRGYDGPILAAADLLGELPLSDRMSFGVSVSGSLGVFGDSSIESSGFSASGQVIDPAVHGWLGIGARLAARF